MLEMKMSWFIKRLFEKMAVLFRYCKVWLIYRPKGFVSVLGNAYLNNPNIEFGRNVVLYPNVHIFGPGKVILGDNVCLGDGTVICSASEIVIGADTMVAAQCYITDCNHGMNVLGGVMRKQKLSIHSCRIGENAWLGWGCKVLAGAEILNGAVIGAGTVVTGIVDENTIYVQERHCRQKLRR